MSSPITLRIWGDVHEIDVDAPEQITIKETDRLQFIIRADACILPPEIHIEDYEARLTLIEDGSNLRYETEASTFLSESFGMSVIRIYLNDKMIALPIDVLAKNAKLRST